MGDSAKASELHESVRRHLAGQDIRYTRGRRSLVATMVTLDGPASAAELHRRMDTPLSSLYRSLTVLDEAGVLRKHHDADGLARFELAEWLSGHHHHIICVRCGTVEDFELAADEEERLHQAAVAVAERRGYRLSGHNLEVEGVCRPCQR